MSLNLPPTLEAFNDYRWPDIAPFFKELEERPLTADSVDGWLSDWSRLERYLLERATRWRVAMTQDTADEVAEAKYEQYLTEIYPPAEAARQRLKQRLLASGLNPAGFDEQLRQMRSEADLYREANVPLLTEEDRIAADYNRLIGAQTVVWDGEEQTLTRLRSAYQTPDRARREAIWRLAAERRLVDRAALNALWRRAFDNRRRLAANAGRESFRDYHWQRLQRFDYTPADSARFRDAIEAEVTPVAARVYERVAAELGVAALRPWDLDADVFAMTLPALRPFDDVDGIAAGAERVIRHVDPQLGAYFSRMRAEGLLDLPNRVGKAPGGYCTSFPLAGVPFIFMNAVGLMTDVKTMLHEAGHAFHVFELGALPYIHQWNVGAEFAEVASMSMELLAAPYLAEEAGGFVSLAAARATRRNHLRKTILFWPYMAVVDAFQHWAYTNPEAGADPAACDVAWTDLWRRFLPGVDWTGLDDVLATGWHRKQHIFRKPFYYVEYGMAHVGAIQVWQNAQRDQAGAVAAYRRALALGATRPLPELYAAAGATFQFDRATMRGVVATLEEAIEALDTGD